MRPMILRPTNIPLGHKTHTPTPSTVDDVDDDCLPYCPACQVGVPLDQVDYGDGKEWYLCNMCGNLYLDDEVLWDDSDDPFDEELP